MAEVATAMPESFTSATPAPDDESSKLQPSGPESSSSRSNGADSADDEKHLDAAGQPSANISGASSITGTAGGSGLAPPQPSAKKGPQSFFSGSKIRHLKKADGIPLWREDIQYDFLDAVFQDTKPVFTNAYTNQKGCNFADVYVDAMARSSKTSKILRDKLMHERDNALNMAMVCLLVNLGRMNTTLNFFPEMKAQLRTYHSIPSLQAHSESTAYKQLQDAPRLKSILKGACEDKKEPQSLSQLTALAIPRTNPINLVFLLTTYAPKITEMHFPDRIDFYDLVMRPTLSSKSRARAFLWLMWLYLESNFTEEDYLNNPYGAGVRGRRLAEDVWLIPNFEYLTEEQATLENVDTESEKIYGEEKRLERKRLLGDNLTLAMGRGGSTAPRCRKSTGAGSPDAQSPNRRPHPRYGFSDAPDYDSDPHTRSGSPDSLQTPHPRSTARRITAQTPLTVTSSVRKAAMPKSSDVKPTHRIIFKSAGKQLHPDHHHRHLSPKPRMTSHQLAVQQNRQERVEHIINCKLRHLDRKKRKVRMRTGAIMRAWQRIKEMEDPLMVSDDEAPAGVGIEVYDEDRNVIEAPTAKKRRGAGAAEKVKIGGPAGLVPRREEEYGAMDDFGEEALSLAAALRRSMRRLERWQVEVREPKQQQQQRQRQEQVVEAEAEVESEEDDEEEEDPDVEMEG